MTFDHQVGEVLAACFQHRMSITVCGGTPGAFSQALQSLLAFAHREQALVLLEASLAFEPPSETVRIVSSSDATGTDFLRSALRQDPDCVAMDHRSAEALSLAINAKLTGHRLILHLPGTVAEAQTQYQTAVADVLPPDYASTYFAFDLFLQLAEGPDASLLEVWQALPQTSGAVHLARLFHAEAGTLIADEATFQTVPPPQPAPIDNTPMELPEDRAPRQEPLLQELRRHLGDARRVAWGPVFGDAPTLATRSQFGGTPQLATGESWPRCGSCQARMQLVAQIDLSQAPEPLAAELGREGLFQFFYCISDHCSVPAAWEPFSDNSLSRVLVGETVCPRTDDVLDSTEAANYGSAAIVGWSAVEEGPSSEERSTLWPESYELYGSWLDNLSRMAEEGPEATELRDSYRNYLAHFGIEDSQIVEVASYLTNSHGDKLLGWPAWSQGVEYPPCPDCAKPMTMLLQINNDGYGPSPPACGSFFGQLFAGDGNGHIFHCREHSHLTFAWACG